MNPNTSPSRRTIIKSGVLGMAHLALPHTQLLAQMTTTTEQEAISFFTPPDDCRPWVYWYFMDGNLTREGMTADLEALKRAGLGGALYLEVGIGVTSGPIEFMSSRWQSLLGHAFDEGERLGLEIALAAGPGWCGTGGPWVKPEQSMQLLVASEETVTGPTAFNEVLPRQKPRTPFFGEDTLPPDLRFVWQNFYRDVVVLAFPTPTGGARIADIDEKALYTRGSYSSQIPGPYSSLPAVRAAFMPPNRKERTGLNECIDLNKIVDLTGKLDADGRLTWQVPSGNWTILRFGRTITGQTTRPAPKPGLGLEVDKFDRAATDAHLEAYLGSLLKTTGNPKYRGRGLTTLHFDSWEMSSQNWSEKFPDEFRARRGYDLARYLPTFAGFFVDSDEISERFLWDIRQTSQELVLDNHITRLRNFGRSHGLQLSLEPYDLNPCGDLTLGSVADVPMGEFWSKGWDVKTDFSIIEATSIGHTLGKNIIGAEAFTADMGENGHQYPARMKAQGDWAFCAGINRLVFHRYQAQPANDQYPGMMMGPNGGYGVDWQRTQTWWDLSDSYHLYLTRCQHMLRQGMPIADILYLAQEGAPNVFLPPRSAMRISPMRDRKSHNFDACAPETLLRASVKDGRIKFPEGMTYQVLVLPRSASISVKLLAKVLDLVEKGATVIGMPPSSAPTLADYPDCDKQVQDLAVRLWGKTPLAAVRRSVGKGFVYIDAPPQPFARNPLAAALWIWAPDGSVVQPPVVGTRYFRRSLTLDPNRTPRRVTIVMTSTHSFVLCVNGHRVGGSAECKLWHQDVTALIQAGENNFNIVAENGARPLPRGGVVGAISFEFSDGHPFTLYTDTKWESSSNPQGPWLTAAQLGGAGQSAWDINESAFDPYEIYPSYEETTKVLAAAGVLPDFEGGDAMRYAHRQDGDRHIYFVANALPEPQNPVCVFRVSGKHAEWWSPIDGKRRPLPEVTEEGGLTRISLHLEAHESGFVIFSERSNMPSAGRNFPPIVPLLTLNSPWDVSFDPAWGGPADVRFERLTDWATRPEEGIRHYSGKARYRTNFSMPELTFGKSYYLTLGDVKHLASVTLNGKKLGSLWCAPWRIQLPESLLYAGNNTLEITVANLWINRLIGDSALPPERRFTRTTSNPFHPDAPLEESGLLGPVRVETISTS